jgi:hypothetical protein
MNEDDSMDLAAVYALLEDLYTLGAVAASAMFLTGHGLVTLAYGPAGRAMAVNGEAVPIEQPS